MNCDSRIIFNLSNQNNMKHTIKLFIDNGHWMATFSEPEIVELFGTDTIETAFMAAASAERVLSEIQALNPDCNVTIAK